MPVIALVGNKGGAGKTTLAVNLADALSRRATTVILDADPQGSALQWQAFGAERNELVVLDASEDPAASARKLLDQYEHIVIDCPPSVHAPQLHAALSVADVALIPVQPSPVDLWATVHIEKALERARAENTQLAAMIVINQLEARTTLSRLMREAVSELDVPVARTAIRRRAVYRSSALEGRSVLDMGRRGADAVAEIEHLLNEVIAS
ncbi:MAG: ParA family partition ATPase [Novosphingobium sp.]